MPAVNAETQDQVGKIDGMITYPVKFQRVDRRVQHRKRFRPMATASNGQTMR